MAGANATIEIFIDLSKYGEVIADRFAQRTAAAVTNFAKQNAEEHKDTRNLQGLIQTVQIAEGYYTSEVEETYSLAQEYGLAPFGKPNYGFKPYMRPAADEATTQANANQHLDEAEQAALNLSRV